jgi:hypothetical protein
MSRRQSGRARRAERSAKGPWGSHPARLCRAQCGVQKHCRPPGAPLRALTRRLTAEGVLAVVAIRALGARRPLLIGPLSLHVPPAGGEDDAEWGGRPFQPLSPFPYSYSSACTSGSAEPLKTCWENLGSPGSLWLTKADPIGALTAPWRAQAPDYLRLSSLGAAQSRLPHPRGPQHSRGLVVAHQ